MSFSDESNFFHTQGHRQDSAKGGGADVRHEILTPLRSGVLGPSGVWALRLGILTRIMGCNTAGEWRCQGEC